MHVTGIDGLVSPEDLYNCHTRECTGSHAHSNESLVSPDSNTALK